MLIENIIGKNNRELYIDIHLKSELDVLIKKLNIDGFMGIISSSNLKDIGSEEMVLQLGSYIAWRIAGGRIIADDKGKIKRIIKAKNPLNFSSDNIVSNKKDLMKRAKKSKPNSVFIYNLSNKELTKKNLSDIEDELNICTFCYRHIVLIVVKDFAKLSSYNLAVRDSKFLVNVKLNDKKLKGLFDFYKDERKSLMHHRRKSDYNLFTPTFSGRFMLWKPIWDKE